MTYADRYQSVVPHRIPVFRTGLESGGISSERFTIDDSYLSDYQGVLTCWFAL